MAKKSQRVLFGVYSEKHDDLYLEGEVSVTDGDVRVDNVVVKFLGECDVTLPIASKTPKRFQSLVEELSDRYKREKRIA
jgi:hypothetical protein